MKRAAALRPPRVSCYDTSMKRRVTKKKRALHPSTVLIIRQVIVGVLIFSFLGMLVSSVWYGTRIPALTLHEIVVQGGETISHSLIEEKVQSQLAGTYLGLVPRAFAFTFPQKAITTEVSRVERIKDVRVERSSGETLVVTFDEYHPDALWCTETESSACFFIDETGYSFTTAPLLKGGSLLRVVTLGVEPQDDVQAILPADYQAISELVSLLRAVGWHVYRADIDVARDAYLQVVGGGEFKVTLTETPEKTVDNLLTILLSDEFAHIAPGNFQYIDLRFGNKVFVNESKLEETASSSEAVQVEG